MNKSIIFRLDWMLLLVYLVLVSFGIVNVYSATFSETSGGLFDLTQAVGKQVFFLVFSLFTGIIILAINSKFFEQFASLGYFISILLLVGLFVFGKTVSGATSWYNIGGISFQPSELAKVTTALIIASLLSKFQSDIKTPRTLFKIGAYVLLPFLLIVVQPDPGSALVFGAFFFPLFREGLNYSYLIIFLSVLSLFFVTLSFPFGVVVGIIVMLIFLLYFIFKKLNPKVKIWPFLIFLMISIGFSFSVDYIFDNVFQQRHRDRINIVLGKEVDTQGVGYNINQSKIAIGSGGLKGKGFLEGTQTKGDFVPEQHTDYIFSTIGEEWGFTGSFFLIFLFCLLVLRIILQAEKQTNKFRRIYSYGIAGLIFIHFFINIGMSLGMVPTIGIPLPFVSYGGSSILAFSIMVFIHLNFDANRLNDW
ncbi:MAG: rod shape-determining protein RodA [Flavobacteriaceae bacterium]|jgi:rod shape determining protein RodA|nr:rod shape-determining protein RodA [Flavobacteriaceae bacterium]MBT6127377.1 rod shape-determining protein RodA [Flavobacteriaceae bacterium]|tara:strand:+ start:867 stop:2126 length:1260 start_codon:yes stop_codon:yes gene_type:complete